MLVSHSGKGDWKIVRADDDVALSVQFGCRYVRFHLQVEDDIEPVAKRKRSDVDAPLTSAFDVLLARASRRDHLPGKLVPCNCKDELFNDVLNHIKVRPGHVQSKGSCVSFGVSFVV